MFNQMGLETHASKAKPAKKQKVKVGASASLCTFSVGSASDKNSELDFEISIMSLGRDNLELSESNFSI